MTITARLSSIAPPQSPERHVSEAEWAEIVDALTRREFLTGGAALGALGLGVAACGTSGHTADADAKGWTYTDDVGRRVHLDRRPTRIATLVDTLTAELWQVGVHPVASPMLLSDWESALRANGVPLHGRITPIGAADGSGYDLEALARAKPDLIISNDYQGKLVNIESQPQVAKIAPVIGLEVTGTVTTIMDSRSRLARALGIELADRAAEAQYKATADRLRRALAAKPSLRVLWCQYSGSDLWIDDPTSNVETKTVASLGAHVYYPSGGTRGGVGESVSWELAPGLPVDLVIYEGNTQEGSAPTSPAWKLMPAVKAGQSVVFGFQWQTPTYTGYAPLLQQVAAAVDKAKPGIGPR